MAMTILVCPSCQETSRTARTLSPGAKVRCGKCGTVSRCFIHYNGAIELRLQPRAADVAPPLPGGTLPPRVGGQEEFRRTIFSGKRKNRPIGGYLPFEKARSYIGTIACVGILAVAGFTAYWYCAQIVTIQKASGRSGGNPWKRLDDAKRKEFRERQRKALARLKAAG